MKWKGQSKWHLVVLSVLALSSGGVMGCGPSEGQPEEASSEQVREEAPSQDGRVKGLVEEVCQNEYRWVQSSNSVCCAPHTVYAAKHKRYCCNVSGCGAWESTGILECNWNKPNCAG